MKMSQLCRKLLLVASAAWSVSALGAPPQAVVSMGEAEEGSMIPVPIDVSWLADGTVVAGQFDIAYNASMTVDISACSSGIFMGTVVINCSQPAAGLIRFSIEEQLNEPLPDIDAITINFGVAALTAGTYPLTVQNEIYGNSSAQIVPSGGSTDGEIVISASPQPSALVIKGGYMTLDVTNGTAPINAHCQETEHEGRMIYDNVNNVLYICSSTGWRAK